jgi:LPXTG-site transpeptidase (sortase) family protein
MTFLPATLVIGGTATVNPPPYFDAGTNTLTISWDVIRLTETATVTFQATYVGPPPVVNTSFAEWSSLEIDPVTPGPPPVPVVLSPYNPAATERWYEPAAPGGVNNYAVSDSVTINAGAAPSASRIPETGFAPERVTILPEQSQDDLYDDLDNLWLEIPSLGVRTTITGVPQAGDGWDITWLWDQAGYLEGTAFPTWAGNSAITAHVYTPDGLPGPFVDLGKLSYGDQVIIHAYGQRYIYEVRSNRKVSPQANVFGHEEYPWITLITCQGYNEASDSYRYRVVVQAVQVRVEPE